MGRSSAWRAMQLTSFDHVRQVFNAGIEPRYATRRISLDDYAATQGIGRVDILKVDTDGADLEVLRGAEQLLRSGCLCVCVECVFHGSLNRYTNCFANIDLFLRELGFALYTLEPFNYTKAELPGPFCYDMFAQTRNGQVIWADAAYLRDLAAPGYSDLFGFRFSPEQILKLACLFEQHGLNDCAAELIVRHADLLPYPAGNLLDYLVPDYLGPGLSYREYIRQFETNPSALYPSRQPKRPPGKPLVAAQEYLELGDVHSNPSWGAIVQPDRNGGLIVQTAAQRWAYAATLPLPLREGGGLVALDIHVREGRVGLAIMGPSEMELSAEVWIAKSERPCEAQLPVTNLLRQQKLLVRNGSGDECSVVTVRRARLLRV